MRRIFPLLAVALCLTLAACGSREVLVSGPAAAPTITDPASDAPLAGVVAETASEAAPRGARPADATPDTAAGDVPEEADRPFGGATPGPAPHNTMPLEVRLSHECARPGQRMSATAVTLASSKLAFAATYEGADRNYVPDFTYVPAEGNPTGTFTWTWIVQPQIRPGDALVTVVAAKDDKGASYHAPFRVERSC